MGSLIFFRYSMGQDNELDKARKAINEIDARMAGLFEERMQQCREVAEYKKKSGLCIFDDTRERAKMENAGELIDDPEKREFYVLFQKHLMDLSKDYQRRIFKGMKIAYCGVPGAFAHIAAQKAFPEAETVPYSDFSGTYSACVNGDVDVAILPIENSFAGDVGTVLDLAYHGDLYINSILDMNITQNLLGVKGADIKDINTVISHPQAIRQSAEFLSRNSIAIKETNSTAHAAKAVSEMGDRTVGAIASEETASIYGLDVMVRQINTSHQNQTRFAVFSRSMNSLKTPGHDTRFILVFAVRNEAGALAKALNIIGSHGYNMSYIHSRPAYGPDWNHYFFAELEGDVNGENGKELLRQMKTVCDNLRLVGSYRHQKI